MARVLYWTPGVDETLVVVPLKIVEIAPGWVRIVFRRSIFSRTGRMPIYRGRHFRKDPVERERESLPIIECSTPIYVAPLMTLLREKMER